MADLDVRPLKRDTEDAPEGKVDGEVDGKVELSYLDATSVVCDLKQLQSAVFDENFQCRRTSIHGIFHQLLESMHWRHNDFAGRDFVDHVSI